MTSFLDHQPSMEDLSATSGMVWGYAKRRIHSMLTSHDKERAKDVIVAIIEEAGGVFDNKTNLFKAFFHAHVEFARSERGFLTTWPIVKMPNGPGIHDFNTLIGELIVGKALQMESVNKGQHSAFRFRLNQPNTRPADLPDGARRAIQIGVKAVKGKCTGIVSDESHNRAWQAAQNGKEINLCLDLIGDDESAALTTESEKIAAAFDAVWPQ